MSVTTDPSTGSVGLPLTMTPKEYARFFGLSERYVQLLCQRGELKAVQLKRGGKYHIPTKWAFEHNGIELEG